MRSQTFQKRQKEMARKDKQRAKAERKMQRKLEKNSDGPETDATSENSAPEPENDPDDQSVS